MNNKLKLLKRILDIGKSYIHIFILLGVIGLALIPVDLYGLILSRKLIDEGFLLKNWNTIKQILLILIIIFIVRSFISHLTTLLSTRAQLRMNQMFQNKLFSHTLHLPMRFFTREPVGQLMSRILDDAARFASIFSQLFGKALIDPLTLLVLIIFLAYYNFRLCAVMIVSSCLSLLVIRKMGNKLHHIAKEMQIKNVALYSYVEQMFSNIELIKSKTAEEQTATHFHHLVDEWIHVSLKIVKVALITQPILQFLKYATLGALFIYGSWMISTGLLTIGTLTIFLGAAYLFFNSLSSLGKTYGSLLENLARMEIIFAIMDSPPERSVKIMGPKNPLPLRHVEFNNVFFGYNPLTPVLKNISFAVLQGETLGITGQSGSGKTTLIRLLVRFYEADAGEIIINDRLIRQFDQDSLRANIGIVFQDNLILNDTIKNNIAYGNNDIPMDQIIEAAQIARAHDFITLLPDQYQTNLSGGGKNLSGGEKQRLAIARAVVTQPDILIFDEGTSFLEIEEEKAILEKILANRKDKITIIISHRLSAMQLADRILTLDNGRILETDFQYLAGKGKTE